MKLCPKCKSKPGLSLNDGKPPRQWSCGSGWDGTFEPPVFVQSKPCETICDLTAALAREKRERAALLVHMPGCPVDYTDPMGNDFECQEDCPTSEMDEGPERRAIETACWRKWAEVEADKATNAPKAQGGK